MTSQSMNLFSSNIEIYQKLFEEISLAHPELNQLMDDLIYPMKFLCRLAQEAEGVLNNDPNSIEKMRYLLIPASSGSHDIQEAVSELLPKSENNYRDLLTTSSMEADDGFIHYGELVICALAAGRVGMQSFNFSRASSEFIDIVKMNAWATLPVQALARVLRAGFNIDNFIDALKQQAKNGNSMLFLKTLAKAFWDTRELVSACAVDNLMSEVKVYFEKCSQTDGWNGSGAIEINHAVLNSFAEENKYPLELLTNVEGEKEKLIACFVWENESSGESTGFEIQKKSLNKQYKKDKNKVNIGIFEHHSGWVGLQTEEEIQEQVKFCARIILFWKEKNASNDILLRYAIPLERLPGQSSRYEFFPIVRRENGNRWGPEIRRTDIELFENTNINGEVQAVARIQVDYLSEFPVYFQLAPFSDQENTLEFHMAGENLEVGSGILELDTRKISANEDSLLLSLYVEGRAIPFDQEVIDIKNWIRHFPNEGSDSHGDESGEVDDGNDVGGDGGGNSGNGDDGQSENPGNTDINPGNILNYVLVRPAILEPITDASDAHYADVKQVPYANAVKELQRFLASENTSAGIVSLPVELDEEVTFISDSTFLDERQQCVLLNQLNEMSDSVVDSPANVWLSIVESSNSFYKVDVTTNSNGLIVCTLDKLSEAFQALGQYRTVINSGQLNTPESALVFEARLFNGEITVDSMLRREKRILNNDGNISPSPWLAFGYSRNSNLLFEHRVNLPSPIFSGRVVVTLPDTVEPEEELDKIELRYQPELFAIEVGEIRKPRIANATIRQLSTVSMLKGAAFRRVSPMPTKQLVTLHRVSGSVKINLDFIPQSNTVEWVMSHTAGLDTDVAIIVGNNDLKRIFRRPTQYIRSLNFDNVSFKKSQKDSLGYFQFIASDGWNSRDKILDKTIPGLKLKTHDYLPREKNGVYWVDPDIHKSVNENTRVNWLVNGKNIFGQSIHVKHAVRIPIENINKSDISIEPESVAVIG